MRAAWLVAVVLVAPALAGQQPTASEPEAVMRAFLAAIVAERWHDAAGLVELAPFEAELQNIIANARRPQRSLPPLTVEDLQRHEPEMPREVAEYQLRRMRELRARYGDGIAQDFARVPDVDSLAKLGVREAAARRLEARDERTNVRRRIAVNRERCPNDSVDESMLVRFVVQQMPRVIGAVVRDDIAYVVLGALPDTAQPRGAVSLPSPHVVRLVRWGERWLVRDWGFWRGSSAISLASTCPPTPAARAPR
ncbi:MAG TPA: hypothetical protein VEA99_03820 [Gemmatimonadaceae bacterium]|nr:hypothetical protein [Gemmatimonadaceae bacterium]